MLCQKCHKSLATVRYAEVVDGRVTEQHLCPQCLAVHQQQSEPGFALPGAVPVTKRRGVRQTARETLRTRRVCPSCGMPMRQLLDDGKVGCITCYTAFGQQIESILEGLHVSLQHKGKIARYEDSRARLRADLQGKRALLRSVLRMEHYEEAAKLRDEIRELEMGLSTSEAGAD